MFVARNGGIPDAGLAGLVTAGIGGLGAGLALAGLGTWYWKRRSAARRGRGRIAELAAGIRLVTAELRAGSHPAAAVEGAAAEASPEVADMFGDMAATARLGGSVATVVEQRAKASGNLRDPMCRIGRAWALAERHGIALADVLDAIRRDLDQRVAFARDVDAKMAGPRASAAVLAGLPVLGLLLGEAAGAGPLAVLTDQVLGQVLLVLGAGLLCAGLLWTVRITEAVVPT